MQAAGLLAHRRLDACAHFDACEHLRVTGSSHPAHRPVVLLHRRLALQEVHVPIGKLLERNGPTPVAVDVQPELIDYSGGDLRTLRLRRELGVDEDLELLVVDPAVSGRVGLQEDLLGLLRGRHAEKLLAGDVAIGIRVKKIEQLPHGVLRLDEGGLHGCAEPLAVVQLRVLVGVQPSVHVVDAGRRHSVADGLQALRKLLLRQRAIPVRVHGHEGRTHVFDLPLLCLVGDQHEEHLLKVGCPRP
mmetsp:Transcript_26716/g.84633  ORF Transcript_26716/g.84633 Transcript_26716/m.84633 type:complete len:245 (+) Transcript_26716:48-782(+)